MQYPIFKKLLKNNEKILKIPIDIVVHLCYNNNVRKEEIDMEKQDIEKVLEELKKVIVNPAVTDVKITITVKKPKSDKK